MQLILISGLSGSGKSIALNVLEDARYYCVDNLPAPLLFEAVGLLRESGYERMAVSIDARSGTALTDLPAALLTLKSQGIDVRLLFLDANTETLIKRFSETRRKHPLSDGNQTLAESIARERDLLQELVVLGHHIDTSDVAPNTLRAWIRDLVEVDRSGTTLLFQSFGFKEGIPLDADLVFDVRCLPNPFYDPKLRPLCGMDREVCDFLEAIPDVASMLQDIGDFVERWLPHFLRDNRAYLTVAIGCTGGQHRSVYMVERLAERFQGQAPIVVRHRQLPPR
ncbi:MAG TPA: RNase adapter RapZ [Burkholderiales bacterium]|nr:RNase adapter RapZ [Burkholderiales bacterium]